MILYSGMELYLDFINLFIRLLSITSRRRWK
jgi:FtsH-binding integral membrane protein